MGFADNQMWVWIPALLLTSRVTSLLLSLILSSQNQDNHILQKELHQSILQMFQVNYGTGYISSMCLGRPNFTSWAKFLLPRNTALGHLRKGLFRSSMTVRLLNFYNRLEILSYIWVLFNYVCIYFDNIIQGLHSRNLSEYNLKFIAA